ncbi:MAG: tRNA (adenosine(37)-N6)-threonylcarbamoyltransferase complex transferase subunit TsaD [Patescibacteria group bacterium]
MIILGIETSCDETALSLIESADGQEVKVLADQTLSQIELHQQYGGVFPNLAKRAHSRNLIPLFKTVLAEAGILKPAPKQHSDFLKNVRMLLEREKELERDFAEFIPTIERPRIDAIAVTAGPGLEPCLWTGINFAKALSLVWDIPVVPVNHMEGHVFSALLKAEKTADGRGLNADKRGGRKDVETFNFGLLTLNLPAIALLISGGHTELVLIKRPFDYEIIGQTRDDAVGEAFDKVARLLGLPYPGGPPLSALAEQARKLKVKSQKLKVGEVSLPRPMLHSGDFDFSFSGLKTAVLYLVRDRQREISAAPRSEPSRRGSTTGESPRLQSLIAREFEDAVTEVLIAKTKKALEQYGARALLIGGGVIANTHIRRNFEALGKELGISVYIPEKNLTTDNALMIAVAGLARLLSKDDSTKGQNREIAARGGWRLDEK